MRLEQFLIRFFIRSGLADLRGGHPPGMAALAVHHPRHPLPDHAADEHLPLHRDELQLRTD